jgi:tRNA(fMet)-specific endonuclease VapC
MSATSLLLLDTNVVLHLVRGKATGLAPDREFGLRMRPDRPLISVITVGEMLAFAARLKWGAKKVAALKQLTEELVVVDVRNQTVLEKYAEIDAFMIKNGHPIGTTTSGLRQLLRQPARACSRLTRTSIRCMTSS